MRRLIYGSRLYLGATLVFTIMACAIAQPTSQSTILPVVTATQPPSTPQPTVAPILPAPAVTATKTLSAGQWNTLIFHDRFQQVMLVNGGPERGHSPDEPLELWGWDGSQWTLWAADPNGPRWRNWAGAAYDSARGRLVIYGGVQNRGLRFADTWEWDGQTWTEYAASGPGPREGVGMAYDAARGKVVLFGGVNGVEEIVGDTWEWDGEQWTQVTTAGPAPRFPSAMGYDGARGTVLLFGGHSLHGNNFQNYDDLWAWDGATWRELASTTTGPGVRNIAQLVFDPFNDRMLLFGGGDGSGTFVSDVWAWDGANWAQIATAGAPAHSGSGGAYDVVRGQVILFGGVKRPGGKAVTETWEWDGQTGGCVDGCQ